MKRVVLPLAFLALAAALLHAQVIPAHACVPAPNDLVIERAELVIAGTITGWEPAPDIEPPQGGMVPLRLHMTIAASYKGGAPGEVTFLDLWSRVRREWDGMEVWGTLTDCPGNFQKDPTQKAALLALGRDPNYGPVTFRVFYLGDSLEGQKYEQSVAGVTELVIAGLPRGGGPPAAARQSGTGLPRLPVALASGAGGAALLAASASLLRRRIMGHDDSTPGP